MPRAELRSLTTLRGIAALAVVLQHYSATAAGLTDAWIPSLVPHGYMAVDFFFVLSGFIMAYTYGPAFEAHGMREYLPFLLKRVARIVPLGLAVTLLILLGASVASLWGRADLFIPPPVLAGDLGAALFVNLAHLQGFFPKQSFNGPAWSVSLEFAAYLAFPLLLTLFFGGLRRAALAALLSLTVVVLCWASGERQGWSVPQNLACCLAEFGLGLLTYRLDRESPRARRLGEDRWTIAITVLTLALLLARQDLVVALCFPALILAYAVNTGRPAQMLAARPLHALGLVSFSLYLVHNMLRAPEAALLVALHPAPCGPATALLLALLGSLLVLPVAALCYLVIEKPGRTALALLTTPLRPQPAE